MPNELPDVPDNLVIGQPAPEPAPTPAPEPATPPVAAEPGATVLPSTPSPSNSGQPPEEPKFEIKVDGKVELLTRAEMTALAQQGKSFTQKSQQLAEERRRWEADQKQILQKERDAAIQKYLADEERKKLDAEKDPGTRALETVRTLEQKIEDQQLDAVLKPLTAKYELDEQQFVIEMAKQGLRSPADVAERGEAIAKAMSESLNGRFEARFKDVLSKGEHPELKRLQEKWLADYLAKKGSGPAPAAGLTPSLGAPPKRAKTLDEAADIAEEMLTGQPVRH
jgi:outer membrane translocation and assembly module TamA